MMFLPRVGLGESCGQKVSNAVDILESQFLWNIIVKNLVKWLKDEVPFQNSYKRERKVSSI